MADAIKGFQDRWNRTSKIEVDNRDLVCVNVKGKNQWVSVGEYTTSDKYLWDGSVADRLKAVLQAAKGTYHRDIQQASVKPATPPPAKPAARQLPPDFANQALRQLAAERRQHKDPRPVTNGEIAARARQLKAEYYKTPTPVNQPTKAIA